MRFEIFKKADNSFSYELLDTSACILSSPAYDSVEEAVEAIKKLVQIASSESNYLSFSDEESFKFSINDTGQQLAVSEGYETDADRQNAISSLVNDTFQDTDFDVSYTESRKEDKQKLGFIIDANSYDFARSSSSGKLGFEEITGGEKSNIFHFNDASGKAILYSQAYASSASRSSGIRSVIQNVVKDERFEIFEDGGSFYFILKAQTGREMARSPQFKSNAEAQSAIDFLKANAAAFAENYPKPEKKFTKDSAGVDNYRLDVVSKSGSMGFEAFQSDSDKQHFFHFNDDSGKAILFSQGYQNGKARDNGIKSVIKNGTIENRYVTIEENGKYYFSLKAGNKQEIARSPFFNSLSELENAKKHMLENTLGFAANYGIDTNEIIKTEKFSIHIEKTTLMAEQEQPGDSTSPKSNDSEHLDDDYLVCGEYRDRIADSKSEEHPNFIVFTHENGKHYFALLDAAGDLFLRSEGYPTTAARDNGIESVKKNSLLPERFKMEERRDFHYITLRAGNHQEIARSCPYESLADAEARRENHLNPPVIEAVPAIAAVAATDNDDNRLDDDYLVCGEYRDRIADSKSDKYPGFISFTHENGKHYFAVLDADGDLYLRSEGYPTTAARDNGIESVMRNSDIEERYKIEERRGFHFLTLRAGNHQEIARSCPYQHLADAEGRKGKSFAAAGLAAAGLALANIEAPEVVAEPIVEEVIAEPTAEIVAEIPEVVAEEPKIEPVAIAAVTAAIAGATALTADAAPEKVHVPEVHKEKEDDYLPCESYRGHALNDKNNNLALFKKEGQFYFVIYNKDGSVRLRSEGFKTSKERDVEVSGVLRNLNDKNQYSTIEKAGYVMHVLKDKTGREVGRSCPEKIGAAAGLSLADVAKVAAPVAAVAAATQFTGETRAAAPIIEEVAETGGGFARFLPWLLGALLLGGLLWWLMKGCGKKVETPAAVVAVDSVKVDTVTAAAPVVAPVASCNCSGNEEPIFNIPTGVKAKKLTRLGTNPEFALYADLHTKSPAEFYAFLKERSEKSNVDKTFLDRITKAMGYANGFADVTAAAFSELEFPVGTTGNLGWGAQHGTAFDELPDNERDRKAFKIAGNGACDIYFMKTCGNHMFPSSNCK